MATPHYDPSPLEPYFEFPMGAIVVVKVQKVFAAMVNSTLKYDRISPQLGQIVGRTIEQCYGGIQVHYAVRVAGGTWSTGMGSVPQPQLFSEPELELAPPPSPEAQAADEPATLDTLKNG